MKTLLASTAIALSFGGPVFAEAHMAGPFVSSVETEALRGSDLIGARLYMTEADIDTTAGRSEDWDDVGEISDIVLGNSGEVDAVLADIGGFLGMGERTIAVNMDELQFVSDGPDADDYFIVLSGSREQLEGAPEFNEEFAVGRTRAVATTDTTGTGLTTQDAATAVTTDTTSLDDGTVVDNPQTPATAVVEGGEVETDMVETDVVETDVVETDVVEPDMAETEVEEMPEESDGELVVVEGDDAMTSQRSGGLLPAPMMEREGYASVGYDDLTTEDMTGAAVYGIGDDRIGEIGELLMTTDGKLEGAVIDVGGFLGLGEKHIEVPFENLQVMQGEGDLRVYIDATEEQLEALPDYEG